MTTYAALLRRAGHTFPDWAQPGADVYLVYVGDFGKVAVQPRTVERVSPQTLTLAGAPRRNATWTLAHLSTLAWPRTHPDAPPFLTRAVHHRGSAAVKQVIHLLPAGHPLLADYEARAAR